MITFFHTRVSAARVFFHSIIENFGFDFSVVLWSIYFGLKGTALQLIVNAGLPYFKQLGVTGERYQSFLTVAGTPWETKAAIGLLSDAVPLFGYHKRGYIVIMSIVGSIALVVLTFMPTLTHLASVAAALLLLFNLQVASVDLLTEGKYAELMVEKPETGSDLVSFAWGLQSAGALAGSVLSAVMIALFPPRFMFLVALPLALQVILPTVTGWFPERRLPEDDRGIRYEKISTYPDLFKLSVAMTIGASFVCASAFGSPMMQSNVSLIVSLVLALLGYRWLPETLRRANLYLFLNNMVYISINGATDYWYTADEKCVPNGPHFTMTYYVSYANLIGSFASVVGVILFQVYLRGGKFRTAFLCAGIVKVAASFFDFVIINRYNRKIGISDSVFFTLGDAVIYQVILRVELMPAIVLTSKVCPRGMEASVYALLVSFQNLGLGVSRTVGDGLIHALGIRTTHPCNFDNLPLAVLIAHVALPSLIFPLIFILIPDYRMTDDLVNGASTQAPPGFTPVPRDDLDQDEENGKANESSNGNNSSSDAGGEGNTAKIGEAGYQREANGDDEPKTENYATAESTNPKENAESTS